MQGLAAGGDHTDGGGGGEGLDDARPDIGDLLQVVEQQEDVLIVQAALELLEDGLLATVRGTHGVGDQPQRGVDVGHGGEVDEDRPVA